MPKYKPPSHSKSISPEVASRTREKLISLKRRKLYSGKIVGRKITLADVKRVERFSGVFDGSAKVTKANRKAARTARDAGLVVKGNRVVTPQNFRVHKGNVERRDAGKWTRLFSGKRTESLETVVNEAFTSLGPLIAFSLYGNESYRVYRNTFTFMQDFIYQYHISEKQFLKGVVFFVPNEPTEYVARRDLEKEAKDAAYQARRTAARKAYRKRRKSERRTWA